jgi:peptidoglycan/LPS O-acetylase OafA/YrhL
VLLLKDLPADDLLKAILFPSLVISTAIYPSSVLGRVLDFPVLKWVGRLSYSLYIWQQLFIFPTILANSPFGALQHFPVSIVFIFVLAAISYYLIEKPMIQVGRSVGGGALGSSQPRPAMSGSIPFHP